MVLAADGRVELALGDPAAPVFPRSSNKPMQADAMLRAGLDLDGELLALAAASHSGEDVPPRTASGRCSPARADIPATCSTPPDLPLDPAEAERTGCAAASGSVNRC